MLTPSPRIRTVVPPRAITGARIAIHGENLPVRPDGLPDVQVGGQAARVVFASPTELAVVIPQIDGGRAPVVVGGAGGKVQVDIGTVAANGLHQVDNPVIDRDRRLYVTYSGSRGQQVPISIFRIDETGTRESFSSAITNPTSLALSPEGVLHVSSRFEGAVYRIQEDGSAEEFVTGLGIACGLAFAADGTLFVGDRSGTVFAVSPGGAVTTLATLPSSVAAFHLACGSDALYVTAPTLSARDVIYRVGFDGRVDVHYDGFGRPQGLGFGPDGSLFVVEALAGMSGLYRVPGQGAPELVLSAPRLIGFTFGPDRALVACTSDTAYRFPPE